MPSRVAAAVVLAGRVLVGLSFALAPVGQEHGVIQDPAPGQQPENRLAKESSPYLRQHRHNPVDWYPWGEEAFAKAAREQKPIFLSIGYSACHWCHVMAAESFADPEVAKLMNEHFVCVKVDREERPDVDEIYMSAVQAMGKQGGWPLSVWLTPDKKPFYGGTYFPPEDGNGRPSFRRVCQSLADAWKDRRDEVLEGAEELGAHLAKVLAPALSPGEPTKDLLPKALVQAEERYDAPYGGFGYAPAFAPKFPQASELSVLLRLDDARAHEIAAASLHAMRKGGVHDQLGGGFHRYSTDRRWLVPHFEKMLYDNALLATCYLEGYVLTGDAAFADTARSTLDYMLRELQSPEGGFWSSQDAQSEGVEGKFFVWQAREFDAVCGDDAALMRRVLGVTDDGNWEHTNVLWLAAEPPSDAAQRARFEAAKQALWRAREQRVHPATDDKVLVGWNALAIDALCNGYRVLADARYLDAAQRCAGFLVERLVVDGRTRRSWQGGEAMHPGCLEDQAGLADALLSVFEVDGDPRWLTTAKRMLEQTEAQFRAEDGAFWFTADDHEQLVARTKSAVEASTPSGTALAVRAFLRAGLLLGDDRLYGIGVSALRAHHALLRDTPAACPSLVQALWFHVASPQEVVVAGARGDAGTEALLRVAWRRLARPSVTALVHDGNRAALEALSPVFRDKGPVDGSPAAYVCERGVCQRPVTDPMALELPR